MKTLFIILTALMPFALTHAKINTLFNQTASPLWTSEKCTAIEQTPSAVVEGTLGRVIVMTDDESWDIVLLMKVKETGNISSFPMGWANDATQGNPRWENGSFTMKVDFEKGLYQLFKKEEKVLTLECEF